MNSLTILYWYWLTAALLLLGLEILAPGTFFLWMAVASAVVGAVLFVFPDISIATQIAVFSVLSMFTISLGRKYFDDKHNQSEKPLLNQRAAQYIGRTAVLIQPLSNGEGRIKIGDTLWTVHGSDAAEGSKVKIIGTDGMALIVEPANNHLD
jgi:membrane protein implicated in regulation of membrane protease activity